MTNLRGALGASGAGPAEARATVRGAHGRTSPLAPHSFDQADSATKGRGVASRRGSTQGSKPRVRSRAAVSWSACSANPFNRG